MASNKKNIECNRFKGLKHEEEDVMKYATVRPMQVENIKSLRGNEIDQLVVDYHIKDLKSYLLGRETKESARSSCDILRQLGMSPFQISRAVECKLVNLPFIS